MPTIAQILPVFKFFKDVLINFDGASSYILMPFLLNINAIIPKVKPMIP